MICIWKENLYRDITTVLLPIKSKIFDFQYQHDGFYIWFEFEHENREIVEQRTFRMVHTGEVWDGSNATYIKTHMTDNKTIVTHLYEINRTLTKE